LNVANVSPRCGIIIDDTATRPTPWPCCGTRPPRTGAGIDVRVAYDGIEGLRTAREFAPDCVCRTSGARSGRVRAGPRHPERAGAGGDKTRGAVAFTDAEHARLATEAGFDYRLTKAGRGRTLGGTADDEEVKELAARTQELAKQNVELAGQTKELLSGGQEDVAELKQDGARVEAGGQELKDERGDASD